MVVDHARKLLDPFGPTTAQPDDPLLGGANDGPGRSARPSRNLATYKGPGRRARSAITLAAEATIVPKLQALEQRSGVRHALGGEHVDDQQRLAA